jgi:DNA polymerase III delta prime subunit
MHNQNINNKLDSFLQNERIPHIIFYGPPGSGKKTILSRFLKTIYGNEAKMYSNVMFVNCAHSKGIKFIREELKFFAKTNTQLNTGIKFKSIVLLNAEHLTVDAQSAMRRCIEQFSINTRFFVVITNKNKLLIPILSRFCEIYVPPRMNESGNDVNLHNPNIILDNSLKTNRKIQLNGIMDKLEVNHLNMVNLAAELYELAYSTIDIMEWMETKDKWSVYEKANIGMCFMKAKPEFRCEKLLMLFMLDFMFFHSTQELKTLSFM